MVAPDRSSSGIASTGRRRYRGGRGGRVVQPDLVVEQLTGSSVTLTVDGVTRSYRVDRVERTSFVDGPDGSTALVEHERFPIPGSEIPAGSAVAPMPGGVARVKVAVGDHVEPGQVLVVLEAMKMEHTVHAAVEAARWPRSW